MLQLSFDDRSTERVRTIEHEDADALLAAGACDEHRRPHEGVVARADVLHVDDDDVEAVEVALLGREVGEGLAVEADDARGPLAVRVAVDRVADADHVLRVTRPAVLGAEEDLGHDAELGESVDDVDQAARHRRRVSDQADTRAAEAAKEVGMLDEAIEAGLHGRELTSRTRTRARSRASTSARGRDRGGRSAP